MSGGQLVARSITTGREMWRRSAPPGQAQGVAAAGDTVLLVTFRSPPWTLDYTVYQRSSGAVVRQQSLDALYGGLRVRGAAYLLNVATTGGETRPQTLVLDARTGRQAAAIPGVLVAENAAALLFDDTGGVDNPYEPVQLRFSTLTLASLQVQPILWTIPSRPKCGPVQRDTAAPTEQITSRYVYETRQDNCGSFVARFDWTQPQRSPVVVAQP